MLPRSALEFGTFAGISSPLRKASPSWAEAFAFSSIFGLLPGTARFDRLDLNTASAAELQAHAAALSGSVGTFRSQLRRLAAAEPGTCRGCCWQQTSVSDDLWYPREDHDDERRAYNVDRDSKHWFVDFTVGEPVSRLMREILSEEARASAELFARRHEAKP